MTGQVRPINRDKTATRLLGSSSKKSYDPLLDIDWDAPVTEDLAYLPFERVSLYGTAMWDAMTPTQRIEPRRCSPRFSSPRRSPTACNERR